jgi:hypothetical protein
VIFALCSLRKRTFEHFKAGCGVSKGEINRKKTPQIEFAFRSLTTTTLIMTFTLESFVLLADQFASPRGFAARRENHRLHMIGDTSSLRVVSASPSVDHRGWPLPKSLRDVF